MRKTSFHLGMNLLETLTAGMYTDPLSVYREYIQNSVDSIDLLPTTMTGEIRIILDPSNRSIVIRDNGTGISSSVAPTILSSVGISNKSDPKQRGFRGIGRLGGLAFAEEAVFRTKAKGEVVETVQKWNCLELRQLLTDRTKRLRRLDDLYENVVELAQYNHKLDSESYFEVALEGVSSFRNHLLDFPRIADYLAEVAPVPFNPVDFSFGEEIDTFIADNISNYRTYSLILNDQPIYKRYKNRVSLMKGGSDIILGIERINPVSIAQSRGWYGIREELLGAIMREAGTAGIRVRVGNIQVGDGHLLDQCLRESRFNGYLIGEIHVASERLIPNGRRDDFVDNEAKAAFFNTVERQIGLPLSKEIRRRSREKALKTAQTFTQKPIDNRTHETLTDNLKTETDLRKEIINTCNNCPNSERILALTEEFMKLNSF